MKILYIIRHAKSSWDDPSLDDFDRPLNNRGLRDAPVMGSRLAKDNNLPDLLLSSSANRAVSTCRIVADQIGYPLTSIKTDPKLYHAEPRQLLSVIQSLDNRILCAATFGHNPGLTDAVNKLLNTNISNIPTCGIVKCRFDVTSWQQVHWGSGTLVFFDYPKNNPATG